MKKRWIHWGIALVLILLVAQAAWAESDLYDPSIFVIEAQGTWRQTLADGYFVDYACELYLDKVDANDNRVADGLYTGVFWMSAKVEIADYLKKLLKDMPVAMDFEAGGEGICDNLTVRLLAQHAREPWQSYAIPADSGERLPPEGGLVAEGGFIAVPMEAYLNVRASGANGASLQHSSAQASDAEVSYILHIEPDPGNKAEERKATIHLYNAEGMAVTLEGVWRRLPGYREDVLAYANDGKAREILDRHADAPGR